MDQTPHHPIRFDTAMEHPEPKEAETGGEINAAMQGIRETTLKDSGHAIRSVHAKSHGLLRGEIRVNERLPDALAQGLFASPATYPVVIRLSTTPGDILDDRVSTPRGFALKIVGVDGARVDGSEGDRTQDFIMVNGPAFNTPNIAGFLPNLKLLASTTDRAEGAKEAASWLMRRAEAAIEAFGFKSPALTSMGGQGVTNLLGETFYSQVPILYGPYVAKISVRPVTPALQALKDAPLEMDGSDFIRDAVNAYFRTNSAEWDLCVQLRTDTDSMPIEDASVAWPEDQSPYIPVARISVPAQDAWTEAKSRAGDDGLSFSPWHALAAHRPLGSVMRARKAAYQQSAAFRAQANRHPVTEPATAAELPF